MHVETALRSHWSLGQNSILSWSSLDQSILILVVPHYAIAEYTSPRADNLPPRVSPRFITELISGDRELTITQMQKVARLLDIEPINIRLREPLAGTDVESQIIEKMIQFRVEALSPGITGDHLFAYQSEIHDLQRQLLTIKLSCREIVMTTFTDEQWENFNFVVADIPKLASLASQAITVNSKHIH